MQLATEFLHLSAGTIYLISMVCALGVLVLKDVVPNLLVAALLYLVTLGVSLGVMVAVTELHLYPSKAFAAWLLMAILASGLGMAAGLLTLVAANRIGSRLVARRIRAAAPTFSIRHVRIEGVGSQD